MCGIALIISSVRIDLSYLLPDTSICSSPSEETENDFMRYNITHPQIHSYLSSLAELQFLFSIDDIKAALKRRGPDSLGSKTLFLHADEERTFQTSAEEEEDPIEESHSINNGVLNNTSSGKLIFIGATLQLRGVYPITQPLVDKSGNILVYNGEVFGGIELNSDSNDAEVLMKSLNESCDCLSHEQEGTCGNGKYSVPELLSKIKGPWALIYWQANSRTIWFGRDALGRRSLLVHWPSTKDSRFILSSVSPSSAIDELNFWEELPCGVYSLSMSASKMDENLVGKVKRHNWTDPLLEELIEWDRTFVEPKPQDLTESHKMFSSEQQGHLYQKVLAALKESVRRRTIFSEIHRGNSPVAVLFSGGLDSMIVAALLDQCLDPKFGIDLLNVSFDGELAPDRISGRAGVKELKKIAPLRRWNLVEIDSELSKMTLETKHVLSLINPSNTYMDLNIGIALWLAAGGDGYVSEEINGNNNAKWQVVKYKSDSRILLVGSGADEQCAGYGRHRTKFRETSWGGLNKEMKLDMQRIWKRNLGRDDRCIADNGKEARFPFLDEDVIRTLLDIPLWEIADLRQPSGVGDKKILRVVARMLHLKEAAVLPKRAIQFGSRIAQESNRKNYGSNRAANQASAGSAFIHPI